MPLICVVALPEHDTLHCRPEGHGAPMPVPDELPLPELPELDELKLPLELPELPLLDPRTLPPSPLPNRLLPLPLPQPAWLPKTSNPAVMRPTGKINFGKRPRMEWPMLMLPLWPVE